MLKNYMAVAIVISSIITALSTTGAYASETQKSITVTNKVTVSKDSLTNSVTKVDEYCENSKTLVDINDLADALGEDVSTSGDETEVYLNGKKVTVDIETGYEYVDGVKVFDKATEHTDKLLIPVDVVKDKLGILCDVDGIYIHREKDSSGNVVVTSELQSIIKNTGGVVDSTAEGYTPVYDYDVKDYEDNYIDSHGMGRIDYNETLAYELEQKMLCERQRDINEGWHTKGGKFYFLKKGVPVVGWQKDGIIWYYLNADGTMHTGWLNDGGNWYYFYDSGAMAQKVMVSGYYMNESGAWSDNVPKNAPTGVTYKEIINRARNYGYSHKSFWGANDESNTSKSDLVDFEWYSTSAAQSISSIEIRDNFSVSLQAGFDSDDKQYNKDIYDILTMLLPTGLDEVYSKVRANQGVPQTFYVDGRVVKVSFFQGGINFDITDQ